MSGHQGFVLAVRFDRTGTRLFSASIEGDVCVWELERQQLSRAWRCHDGPILDLDYPDDGSDAVFTAGLDGTVGVWRSFDGKLLHRLTGHEGGVHGVAASKELIASAGADRRIGIWDRQTGQLVEFLEGHEETVTSVAFLDSRTLVSGSRDRTVRTWDLREGAVGLVLRGHDWWVTKVGVASGQRLVSASEDCTLRLWDAISGEPVWTFDSSPGPIWGLAIDPTGSRAVVGYGGNTVCVDLNTGRWETLPNDVPVSGRALNFSRDGQLLAIGQDRGDIDLIDLDKPARAGKLPGVGSQIISGIAHPDLQVTSRIGGKVESKVGATITDAIRHRGHEFFVYASRRLSRARFATGAFDQMVRVWQTGSAAPLAEFSHGGLIFSLAAGNGGAQLLCGGGDRISLWDLENLERLWLVSNAGIGGHLVAAFNLDETEVACVGERPILKLWRIGEQRSWSWPLPDAHNCVIEAIPGDNRVVVGSAYGRVSLVDLGDGASVPLHGEHEDWIRSARVAPDGQRLVTVSQNGTGRVYDMGRRRVVERFAGECVAVADFDETGRLHWLDCLGAVHRE